jgi:hypothetical protein
MLEDLTLGEFAKEFFNFYETLRYINVFRVPASRPYIKLAELSWHSSYFCNIALNKVLSSTSVCPSFEGYWLTGYDVVQSDRGCQAMRRNVLPPSAGYLCVYFFNEFLCTWDYKVSRVRIIRKKYIGRDLGESGRGVIRGIILAFSLRENKENLKNFRHICWSQGRQQFVTHSVRYKIVITTELWR